MATLTCNQCSQEKDESKFGLAPCGTVRKRCTTCRGRNYRKTKGYNVYRHKLTLKKYDISVEEYDTLLKEQNYVCAICENPQIDGKRLAVDHCRDTGKVRGLLCNGCNTALGNLGDNEEGLLKAIDYLRRQS